MKSIAVSKKMLAAAQASYESHPEYGLTGDDMRTAIKAALSEAPDQQAEIARLTAEVERLTKRSICEVAATNPSVMEYMRHWEGRAEKAEAERDELLNQNDSLKHSISVLEKRFGQNREFLVACIRGNTKLKEKASKARLEGWRAGRDAAANEAELYSCSEGSDDFTIGIKEGYTDAVGQIVDGIRAMPEPKEANHD